MGMILCWLIRKNRRRRSVFPRTTTQILILILNDGCLKEKEQDLSTCQDIANQEKIKGRLKSLQGLKEQIKGRVIITIIVIRSLGLKKLPTNKQVQRRNLPKVLDPECQEESSRTRRKKEERINFKDCCIICSAVIFRI